MTISSLISLGGYLLILLVVFFFARKIVRPVSESYDKQKRFITDAGHEIKTPLSVIHASADLLEMELGENELLADIKREAMHLSDLTNDLVHLARMEETSTSIPMAALPFSDIVKKAVLSFSPLATKKNQTIVTHITEELVAKGHEKTVAQLVSLLMSNAIKYATEESEITVALEKKKKELVLTVTNKTLEPIPEDALSRLFDRFYRVDSSRNSSTGGFGIGLSVARAIAETHGGKIYATADENAISFITHFPM